MPAHAALQYSADGFDTRTRMMGRQRAGESFFKAWIDHAGPDPLTGFVKTHENAADLEAHARALGYEGEVAIASATIVTPLQTAGALWLADPGVSRYAWHRRWRSQRGWSIVGVTHTLSSHAAMDLVADFPVAPVQPWDALICTSQATRRAVLATLEAEADYLRARVGASRFAMPELPVIPLGVDCAMFAPDPATRGRWRAELGAAEDEVVVLQFGRIALHGKAHPLPLYQALAEAAARGGVRFRLVLAGRFINEAQDLLYRQLAAAYADRVPTSFVDGTRDDVEGVRAAADIFALLADNIQESFGLAPVEGMAAGLPVVAADWDGLRDTVEHGVTGLRVPTTIVPAGTGEALARRYDVGAVDNNAFIGGTAQSTAIDIAAAAGAFHTLGADPELRARMAAAGLARAHATYDWSRVIPAYLALLAELAQRRRGGAEESAPRAPGQAMRGSRLDPFANFAGHATHILDEDVRLDCAPGAPTRVTDLSAAPDMLFLVPWMLPPVATLDRMAAAPAGGPLRAGELLALFPEVPRDQAWAAVGWLLKFGFLRRC